MGMWVYGKNEHWLVMEAETYSFHFEAVAGLVRINLPAVLNLHDCAIFALPKNTMSTLKVNEYFEGKVKSISFQGQPYSSTVGVMAPGDYEFGTSKPEIMTIISGELEVRLPRSADWKKYSPGTKFDVPAHSKFQLKVAEDTAYLCQFLE